MVSDPRKYVMLWLRNKGITINERGILTSPDDRDHFELFDSLYLDYCEQIAAFNAAADKKIQGAKETNLRKALDEYISIELVRRRQQVFNAIKFNGTSSLSLLEEFVEAVTGTRNVTTINVMAHFLWTIKRRFIDKEVVYHIMPIIYGKQNGGKSKSLQRLFKPLANLTLELKLTEITDPRYAFSLSRNYVVILDEMAGFRKADVETLKRQITASYNDVRKLNTNTVIKIKQNASFIGTSNAPVNELIFDVTGARRFYEIRALDKIDWDKINSLDYIALFQGIDENLERGYIEGVFEEVKKEQENLVGLDELNIFMEHHKITSGTKEVAATHMYQAYAIWADTNGIKTPLNSIWFGRKLSNKGLNAEIRKLRGKATRVYLVADDCSLLKESYDPLASDYNKWN